MIKPDLLPNIITDVIVLRNSTIACGDRSTFLCCNNGICRISGISNIIQYMQTVIIAALREILVYQVFETMKELFRSAFHNLKHYIFQQILKNIKNFL